MKKIFLYPSLYLFHCCENINNIVNNLPNSKRQILMISYLVLRILLSEIDTGVKFTFFETSWGESIGTIAIHWLSYHLWGVKKVWKFLIHLFLFKKLMITILSKQDNQSSHRNFAYKPWNFLKNMNCWPWKKWRKRWLSLFEMITRN